MINQDSEVQCGLSWVDASPNRIPKNAIDAGGYIFIIRVKYMQSVIPGMYDSEKQKAFFTWNTKVQVADKFQVLCDTSLPVSSDMCHYDNILK